MLPTDQAYDVIDVVENDFKCRILVGWGEEKGQSVNTDDTAGPGDRLNFFVGFRAIVIEDGSRPCVVRHHRRIRKQAGIQRGLVATMGRIYQHADVVQLFQQALAEIAQACVGSLGAAGADEILIVVGQHDRPTPQLEGLVLQGQIS